MLLFAVDGETASSFMTGVGRTPPTTGSTDALLAAQDLNYRLPASVNQLLAAVNTQQGLGNTVGMVTVTLGFDEFAGLAAAPDGLVRVPGTLDAYQADDAAILTVKRHQEPGRGRH